MGGPEPSPSAEERPATTEARLARTYSTIAQWFDYPEDIDPSTFDGEAVDGAAADGSAIEPEIGREFAAFARERESVSLEEYVSLLELNPQCPLYLGAHLFQDPATCAAAGVSDRNTFMLEIANVYRHFGFALNGELPDFLPAMVEFLSLTAECEGEDREIRARLIEKLMLEGAKALERKLCELETPYEHLGRALVMCLTADQRRAGDDGSVDRKSRNRGDGSPPERERKLEVLEVGVHG